MGKSHQIWQFRQALPVPSAPSTDWPTLVSLSRTFVTVIVPLYYLFRSTRYLHIDSECSVHICPTGSSEYTYVLRRLCSSRVPKLPFRTPTSSAAGYCGSNECLRCCETLDWTIHCKGCKCTTRVAKERQLSEEIETKEDLLVRTIAMRGVYESLRFFFPHVPFAARAQSSWGPLGWMVSTSNDSSHNRPIPIIVGTMFTLEEFRIGHLNDPHMPVVE